MKRLLVLIVPAALLLSGCLGDVMEIFCEAGPDSDHCYQAAAVQEGDPEDCSKIEYPPPRSKCHLMIAENTGDASVCAGVDGGMMGYSEEECLEKAFGGGHSVEDCKNAVDEVACRTAWSKHKKTCGTDYQYDNETAKCKKIEGSDDGIDDKGLEDVKTMAEAGKGKYMELLEKAIENEGDPAKLAGLEAYKKFLEDAGEKAESVQTSLEALEELKKIFIDSYDPSMDIERMPVDKILGKGLFERIKDKMFGEDNPTGQEAESAQAEEALEVYEKMLKRQEDVDFLKKGKGERLKETIISKLKDAGTEKVTDAAKEIAEKAGGTAFAAVGFVGDALKSFQQEAQKQEFIGLARAYNRRRDALEAQNPGMDKDALHKRVVQEVTEDPYRDNTNLGVIKHGNILENKNCADESNPLCIDPHVWWTAMDKTYQYQQKQKK